MEFRDCAIFTGEVFKVPRHIVRVDSKKGHGWQLRYGRSKHFADHSNDGSGAHESLRLATEELARRIAKLPAPTKLKTDIFARKTSKLPLGISGPQERLRPGRRTPYFEFRVSIPLPGQRSTNKNVYIGTANTITKDRYEQALAQAVALRESYVRKYKVASTKAKREKAIAAGLAPKE